MVKLHPDGTLEAFNREYKPLGINDIHLNSDKYDHLPLKTRYNRIGRIQLEKLQNLGANLQEYEDKTICIFLYNDGTNPTNREGKNKDLWDSYFNKLQYLGNFKRKRGY